MQSLKQSLTCGLIVSTILFGFITSVSAEEGYYMKTMREQAKEGDVYSQLNLGLAYYYGDSTVTQNYHKAHEWILKSAKQGDNDAQIYLGIMYEEGKGVRQNYNKAAEYYLKSAKQNNIEAQLLLGNMYREGRGVRQNKAQAKEWYGKSCDNGYQQGCDAYRELNEQRH